jgi:2-polyprenyl-6-methoxyphenol hydroxylase-like FAD-dependent oxidoreductase
MNLIIAGGGIGGLATALSLHRAGIEVRVYERTPAFAKIGAGMSIWPNATRVLRSVGVLGEGPFTWKRSPVFMFHQCKPSITYKVFANGPEVGTWPSDALEKGIEIPTAYAEEH